LSALKSARNHLRAKASFEVGAKPQIFFAHITNLPAPCRARS